MKFCDRCGEETLTACPSCNVNIRGGSLGMYGALERYNAPACCNSCGKQMPWTDRNSQAAIELFIEELQPDQEAKAELEKSIHDVARDTPAAKLGATRLRKALAKLSSGVVGVAGDLLKNIATEEAKKILFPP